MTSTKRISEPNSTRGFASNSPAQQKYVSAKGGRVKVPKGLARLPTERAKEIQRSGGLKRQELKRKEKEIYGRKNPISNRHTGDS